MRNEGVSMNKDKMIEFAKEQCEIFPEDSYMVEYLRKTIKMLQAEPCEDAVSRISLLNKLDDCYKEKIKVAPDNMAEGFMQVEKLIMQEPSVTPTRKKGKWINKSHTSDCGIKFVASECTCCGKKTFFDCDQLVYNYCPNCGSFMSEVEE
jgi:hypothetical protein